LNRNRLETDAADGGDGGGVQPSKLDIRASDFGFAGKTVLASFSSAALRRSPLHK
jgi:hypothetical protein